MEKADKEEQKKIINKAKKEIDYVKNYTSTFMKEYVKNMEYNEKFTDYDADEVKSVN